MKRWIPALALLAGCSSLTGWLSEPVDDPTTTEIPGGGSVVVTPPPAQPPITVALPGGGSAVVTPGAAVPPKTRGELLSDVIGGAAGAVTGNPLLGIGAAAAILALLGKRKSA